MPCRRVFVLSCLLGVCLAAPCLASAVSGNSEVKQGAIEVTSGLGRKLYALPDDPAVVTARANLQKDPKNVRLVLLLSKAQAGRRQYREAIETCTKGLAFAPNNAELFVERGHRELGLREFRAAMADLQTRGVARSQEPGCTVSLGVVALFCWGV